MSKPSSLQKLKMCGTEEEMRVVAARICRNYLHGAWKTVDPSALHFRRISGGLSNFLYFVGLPDGHSSLAREISSEDDSVSELAPHKQLVFSRNAEEPKRVLIRIYGQVHGERAMDAIVTESVIFTLLSERKLGPKLFGVFSGGRIEEYIPARPLFTRELAEPALSMKIAEKMASIHSMEVPLSKEANWIWKTLNKWINKVKLERESSQYVVKNESEQQIINQLKDVNFEAEVEWLKKFLGTVQSPIVFCHNDMQEGNILILQDEANTSQYDEIQYDLPKAQNIVDTMSIDDTNTTDSESSHISDSGEPKIHIIDFEYCAYNHRGFDIANHFQEWAYDYTNPEYPHFYENQESWPTLEQKEIFIREYLKYNQQTDEHFKVPIDAVNQLLNEVEAFALASHLFWCLWSLVNAPRSKIPFGYWEYAQTRFDTYQKLKQEFIKKSGLPQKRKICEVDI